MDAYPVVKQFARTLRNLDAVLDKAAKYAEARKFDVNNFCTARLFPDMLPFTFTVALPPATSFIRSALITPLRAKTALSPVETVAVGVLRLLKLIVSLAGPAVET